MSVEHIAVIVLAVEVVVMVAARVGTERRHWNHAEGRGPAPQTGEDLTFVPAALYGIAAASMAVGALTASVEPTLEALATVAVFGVLLPAFTANAVLRLSTRGGRTAVTPGLRGLAATVAATGGLVSVGLI
ncbi:hypothetical protein [Streptomyces sp. MA15]|uniref:hypothetical protein n=1 Tax=Streptomyces sp. MA15 TaxID=3055061 RepID=UPI0025B21B67|nr:hypothetical protein [Streptomyces sp. MA15]MDN3268403.1 hypothetical protein [Streptomyces sp. MA15]